MNTEIMKREIPVLTREIHALYSSLDQRFHLSGAIVPVSFVFDTDVLGRYTNDRATKEEGFYFSLPFISYSAVCPLSKEDRLDLYLHEYAHYMNMHLDVPEEYDFEPGIHGSAWRYFCSLIGAAPTPYYKMGEGLMKHDYDQALTEKKYTETARELDRYRREKSYQNQKNASSRFQIGDKVSHPKFGEGTVCDIETMDTSVRISVNFRDGVKKLDQKWLIMSSYKSKNERH